MDKEMLERCVAALEQNFKDRVAAHAEMTFEETKVSLPNKDVWQSYTLAVIKAMREPTEAMLEAGCSSNPTSWNEGTDDGFAADVANDVYRAMIGAIINDN